MRKSNTESGTSSDSEFENGSGSPQVRSPPVRPNNARGHKFFHGNLASELVPLAVGHSKAFKPTSVHSCDFLLATLVHFARVDLINHVLSTMLLWSEIRPSFPACPRCPHGTRLCNRPTNQPLNHPRENQLRKLRTRKFFAMQNVTFIWFDQPLLYD